MRALRIAAVVLAAATIVTISMPQDAEACGGFFCSQTPIDQSAERIIFARNGANIESWVQVLYSGAAEDFAWVVPVSSVPEVETAEDAIFQVLDQLTSPTIIPPDCLMMPMAAMDDADGESTGAGGGSRNGDEVTVYASADVGPYHYDVVGSENAQLLVNWLNDNDYIITGPMEPMVEYYVDDQMLFLAMKLQADQGVDALKPVKLTFEGENPVIPLRLTGVAADPHMGVIAWILGDSRATSANYANVELAVEDIRFDQFLRTNYRTVVSRTVDAAGGHAFITEFAGPTADLAEMAWDEDARVLLESYDYLTRMYTTISPEEMTTDPMFTFNANLGDVSRTLDFSDRDDLCEETPSPCDFVHCGSNASCYEVNGAAACECPENFVARGVSDPINGVSVTCTPEDRDMLGDELPADPCASMTCGEFGQCVALNSTATCACDDGYGAQDEADGGVSCVSLEDGEVVTTPIDPDFNGGEGEIVYNGGDGSDTEAGAETGCSVSVGNPSKASWLLVGLVIGLIGIRRKRS